MAFNFQVDGVTIKTPKTFKIDFLPIIEGKRGITGVFNAEGIADKRQFTLTYNSITETELLTIIGATFEDFATSKNIYQTFTCPIPGGTATYDTYFAPYSITLTEKSVINNRWEDVTIVFTER